MIKIVLLCSLFSLSGFLGFQASKIFDKSIKFFEDLLSFTQSLKNEISFLKTDIFSILKKYEYTSNFNDFLKEYEKILNTKNISQNEITKILENLIFLSDLEKNTISQMFFELGNLGYVEQIERLEFYSTFFKNQLDIHVQKGGKMSPFCKKMGFLIGSLLCIVLI